MVDPVDKALFFRLPLELREQVYKAVLTSPKEGPGLIQTCHEIRNEAHKFLYQRPLDFRGQANLYGWLEGISENFLSYATELALSIQDVDLKPLLKLESSSAKPATPPQLLTWQLYEAELARLHEVLAKFPKVKVITLRAGPNDQSHLYRKFLSDFLEKLAMIYPHLLDLRLEGNFHHQDLAFLKQFKRLQAFCFDGFTSSSPTETADILGGLKYLKKLSLISQHAMLTPNHHSRSDFTTKRQSFTGAVARNVLGLASFSVTERIPASSPTLFFTPEVLSSLQTHKTLKSLSVCLTQVPEKEVLMSLENLLESSVLERLELDWPDFNADLLDKYNLYPTHLKSLWVRVKDMIGAFDTIWSICNSREVSGDLLDLHSVVLIRSNLVYETSSIVSLPTERKDSGNYEAADEISSKVIEKKKETELEDEKGKGIEGFESKIGVASTEGNEFSDDLTCKGKNNSKVNFARAKKRLQELGVQVEWYTEEG